MTEKNSICIFITFKKNPTKISNKKIISEVILDVGADVCSFIQSKEI